jgi:glycosyltransferase involved in cell wall biosynthesis
MEGQSSLTIAGNPFEDDNETKSMEQNPEVDIIIPVYNRASYLPSFFKSLSHQRYLAIKVYFACGESQDNTEEVLEDYQRQEKRFPIAIAKVGKVSLGQLRNYWLDSGELKGKYLSFMDVDDYWNEEYIETLVNEAEKNQDDIVQCGFRRIDSETHHHLNDDMVHNPDHSVPTPFVFSGIAFLHTGAPSKLYRLDLVGKDVRFASSQRFEDVAFVCKYLAKAKTMGFVNRPLYDYVVDPNSVSTFTSKEQALSQLEQAKEILLDLKRYYQKANPEAYEKGFVDAIAFVRFGIGLTTRACLSGFVSRKETIRSSKRFLDESFPQWRTTPFLSRKNTRSFGKKTYFVRLCRRLYKAHLFGFFVWSYRLFTKITKKDVRP